MNNRGFTLIELVIYILIFSVGITTIMVMMPQILSKNADSTLRLRGVQVAQATMEKILAKKWDETTPNGGGVTATYSALTSDGESPMSQYDDVDDFNGLSGEASDDPAGFNLTAGFTIDVTISYVEFDGVTFNTATGTSDYKQIKLTVHNPALTEDYELFAVKGNF